MESNVKKGVAAKVVEFTPKSMNTDKDGPIKAPHSGDYGRFALKIPA